MTQHNRLNVKLSNSLLNKLKLAIKNENDVVIRLLANMIGDSNDQTNFQHELLLTDRQVSSIRKVFQIIHQLILNFQKLNYQKWYSQKDL